MLYYNNPRKTPYKYIRILQGTVVNKYSEKYTEDSLDKFNITCKSVRYANPVRL